MTPSLQDVCKPKPAELNHCSGHVELGMRMALWAHNWMPTVDELRKKFSIECTATAYRYHERLMAAKGIHQ